MSLEADYKSGLIADLRRQVSKLERTYLLGSAPSFCFGIQEIDAALPDQTLQGGCLHEIMSGDPKGAGATTGFVSALARGLSDESPVAWISREAAVYMPGLLTYGLTPQQMFFVQTKNEKQTLWAMEEALRSKAFAAVVGEVDKADLTATRRLQLAAEAGESAGLLLRLTNRQHTTSCTSRWIVQPAPSVREQGIPGVGDPCWHVTLDKMRGGYQDEWRIAWREGKFALADAPLHQEVEKRRRLQ